VSGVGKPMVMYGSSGTVVVPRGPVTESCDCDCDCELDVVSFLNEVHDGWNLIGVFPMLEVCLCVIVEEEKVRTARGNCTCTLCAEVHEIMD